MKNNFILEELTAENAMHLYEKEVYRLQVVFSKGSKFYNIDKESVFNLIDKIYGEGKSKELKSNDKWITLYTHHFPEDIQTLLRISKDLTMTLQTFLVAGVNE